MPDPRIQDGEGREPESTLTAYLAANVEMGRHSGIPDCCVAEFCADIAAGVRAVGMHRDMEFGVKALRLPGVQYVPCRACFPRLLAGEIEGAVIHECDDSDPECSRIGATYQAAHAAMYPDGDPITVVHPDWFEFKMRIPA